MLVPLLAFALMTPFQSLEGRPLDPLAFQEAKASVWVFVGTECPISNSYAPELNRLTKEFQPKGVRIYLVYSDPATKSADALKHWQSFHFAAQALLDSKQELMHRAGASKTPEAAVFNPKGVLVYRGRIDDRWTNLGVGRTNPHQRDLHDVIEKVLAGKPGKFPFHEAIGCYIPGP